MFTLFAREVCLLHPNFQFCISYWKFPVTFFWFWFLYTPPKVLMTVTTSSLLKEKSLNKFWQKISPCNPRTNDIWVLYVFVKDSCMLRTAQRKSGPEVNAEPSVLSNKPNPFRISFLDLWEIFRPEENHPFPLPPSGRAYVRFTKDQTGKRKVRYKENRENCKICLPRCKVEWLRIHYPY